MRFWNSHRPWKKICRQEKVFLHLAVPWPCGITERQLAMSLMPEDIPLRQEIAPTITSADGNCLFITVSLALVGMRRVCSRLLSSF